MLAVFSFGCGGPETVNEPPRNVDPVEEAPISQVQQGGTVRVLLPETPACLNPYLPECEGAEALIGTVLEAPLAIGPGLEYKPLLAERMPAYEAGTLSLEPLTAEIRLREGVTFSDGGPLTGADVKWTYEQAILLAKDGGIAPAYAGFERLSRVETPDERTVRLVFDEPYAFWQDLLTAPVFPRSVYEEEDFAGLRLDGEPTGSGAFLLGGFTQKKIQLTENQNYWSEEPLPNLEGMEIEPRTPGKAAESLSNGRADFGFFATLRTPPDPGDLLRASAAPVRVENLLFNPRKLDAETRRTIARAVDRGRIAGEPGGPVAESFVPPEFVPGYTPAWEDYETPGPRGAGQPEGALDLVYPGPDDPVRERLAADIASELSNVGIEAEPRPVPPGDFFGEVLPDGNFDLTLLTTGPAGGYEALSPVLPQDSRELLRQTFSATGTEERARTLLRAQEEMAAEAALLPLFVWPDTMAWSSSITGPRPDTPYRGLMSNAREWAFYK
ncbi:MAG: ABC transporter substrate-binding protein [Rubrobacteraceae bacterium]